MAGCRWVYVVLSAVAVLGLTRALIPHRRMAEFDLHRARAQEMIAAASRWAETSEELSPGEVAAYFRDGGYKLTEKVAAENVGGSQGMGRESGRLQGDSDENVENIDQQDSSPLPAALNDNEEQNPVENGGGGSMQGDKEDTNPAPNNDNDNNNNDNNNNNNNNGNEDEEDTSPLPNVLSEDKNNNNQNQNGYDRSEEGEVEEKTDVSGKYRDDNRLLKEPNDSDVPLEDQVWTQDDREEQEALIEEQKEKQAALWRQEVEEMEEEQEAAMRRLEEEQEAAMRRLEMEQEVAAMRVEEEAKKDNEALKMQDDKQKQPVAPKGMNRDEPDPINPFNPINGGNEEEVVIQSLASMSQVDFRETADIAGYPSRSEESMEPQPSEQEEQDEENAVDNIIEALRKIAGNGGMTPVSPAVPIHTPEQVYPPVYPSPRRCPTFETVNDESTLTRRPQVSAEGRAINQEDVETQGPIEKVLVEAGVMSHESDGGRGQLGQTQDHVDDDNNNQPQPPPDNQPQPPPENQPQPPPENQPQPPPDNQPQPPPDNQPQPPPDNQPQPQPPPDNQPQPPPDNQPQPPPAPGGPQAQQGTAQSNDGEVSVQEAIAHAQALKAFFMNHKN